MYHFCACTGVWQLPMLPSTVLPATHATWTHRTPTKSRFSSPAQVVVVLSGSMEPGFRRGDILFLHLGPRPIRTGEIVVFNIAGRDIPIVHRALKVHEDSETGEVSILTKGDNNYGDDRVLYAPGQVRCPIVLRSVLVPCSVLLRSRRRQDGWHIDCICDVLSCIVEGLTGCFIFFKFHKRSRGIAYWRAFMAPSCTSVRAGQACERSGCLTCQNASHFICIPYAFVQEWLSREHIMGRAAGYLPGVGMITIVMNDYPWLKFGLIGLLGLLVLTTKE